MTRPTHQNRASLLRLLGLLGMAVLITLGVVFSMTWWEDRSVSGIESALNQFDYEAAFHLVNDYLSKHPEDGRGWALKARALIGMDRIDEAEQIFFRYGAATAEDLYAWASISLKRQYWGDALLLLKRALELDPDLPQALHEHTSCCSYLGLIDEALESAERLAQNPEFEARAYLLIGTLHQNRDNHESTVISWRKILELDPTLEKILLPQHEFLNAFAESLIKVGELEEAQKLLEQSIAIRETASARVLLASILIQSGEREKAIASWKRALKSDSQAEKARLELANDALTHQDHAAARRYLEPLLKKDPLPSDICYAMQRITQREGDMASSNKWQERATEQRRIEKRNSALTHAMTESPRSMWSQAYRAYQFAEQGNWYQADQIVSGLIGNAKDIPFIVELDLAIKKHGKLPNLDLIPIKQD